MVVTVASTSVHAQVRNKQNMFTMSQPDGVLQNGWLFMKSIDDVFNTQIDTQDNRDEDEAPGSMPIVLFVFSPKSCDSDLYNYKARYLCLQ